MKHALESATAAPVNTRPDHARGLKSGLTMEDLQIVSNDEELSDGSDSDDEVPGTEGATSDTEMTETAVNLLLSVLEGMYFWLC